MSAARARRIRVLVADDDPIMMDVVADLLRSEGDFELVAVAADALAAIAAARETTPDVAIVDVRMPGGGGPEAARGIREASRQTRIVAYSVYDDAVSVRDMIRADAIGYVVKGTPADELIRAVRSAAEGETYLTPSVAVGVVKALAGQLVKEEVQAEVEQSLRDQVDRALAKGAIVAVYHAIIDLERWRVAGVEALARFQLEPRQPPNIWFEDAGKIGKRLALELAAIRVEAAAFEDPALGRCYVSLNAEPDTIVDPRASLYDELVGIPWDRVVLEVTENAEIPDYDYAAFADALAPFRDRGGRLAIDDAGSGQANMVRLLDLRPDFIKVDKRLTAGIGTERGRRALARAYVSFAQEMGIPVVAEGIETPWDLAVLREMGVQYGQGYFFRKPAPLAAATAPLPSLDALTAQWAAEHPEDAG